MRVLHPRSTWLSLEMSSALAAAFTLDRGAVLEAADSLTEHAEPARVVGRLLGRGVELGNARSVVEALRALRDV